MTNNSCWVSLHEAATRIGVPIQTVENWANTIDPDADYTMAGTLFAEHGRKCRLRGREVVCVINGLVHISDTAVQGWIEAESTIQELRSQGWVSSEAIAKELGMTEDEFMDRIGQFARLAKDFGFSPKELLYKKTQADESR